MRYITVYILHRTASRGIHEEKFPVSQLGWVPNEAWCELLKEGNEGISTSSTEGRRATSLFGPMAYFFFMKLKSVYSSPGDSNSNGLAPSHQPPSHQPVTASYILK